MKDNPMNAEEQYELGKKYMHGDGVPKDIEKALYWYTKAAEQGHVKAKEFLDDLDGMIESEQQMSKIVEQSSADAQFAFGREYYTGDGKIHKNLKKAMYWYTKAAEQGLAEAQFNLAAMYNFGEGIQKDMEKSVHWLTKAAEQGLAKAQNNLGCSYDRGEGVPIDLEKARYWWTKASEQGHEMAQKNLAARSTSGGGCYVATCVYGSYDCPEVRTLRRYRDNKLSASWFGRLFIQVYYAVSPKLVELFGNKKWFNRLCKPILNSFVRKIQNSRIDWKKTT